MYYVNGFDGIKLYEFFPLYVIVISYLFLSHGHGFRFSPHLLLWIYDDTYSVFLLNIIWTTIYARRRQLFIGRLPTSGSFWFSFCSAANRTSAVSRVQLARDRGWTFAPLNRRTMHRKGGFICSRVLASPKFDTSSMRSSSPVGGGEFVTLTRILFILAEQIGCVYVCTLTVTRRGDIRSFIKRVFRLNRK